MKLYKNIITLNLVFINSQIVYKYVHVQYINVLMHFQLQLKKTIIVMAEQMVKLIFTVASSDVHVNIKNLSENVFIFHDCMPEKMNCHSCADKRMHRKCAKMECCSCEAKNDGNIRINLYHQHFNWK